MPTALTVVCPSAPELAIISLSLSLLMMFVAGMVGHGILRPLLEARGLTPWHLRDSLGSMPLVLIGTGLMGGMGTLLAVWGVTGCDIAGWGVAIASGLFVAGVVMVRLGLVALQKLN